MSLSDEEKRTLLGLARDAMEAAVLGQAPVRPQPDDLAGPLGEKRGCFVTLKNRGRLRGCIGTFRPEGPLAEMVTDMAVSAATRDPRFMTDPITPTELGQITVEVSALSPLEQTDAPEQLEVGVHGIYVASPRGAGCFLPEVATEMGWSAEQFLDACCSHKAGLAPGAWREPDTQVYLFTSEKFQERTPGESVPAEAD